MELQAALQAFLLQIEADGRSPHTIGQYRRHVAALATWLSGPGGAGGSPDVADLTPDTVARFFAADAARASCRGGAKKAVSVNAMRTSIRCLCAHLHDAGLVAANPARLLRRARCSAPPPKALHADELSRLATTLDGACSSQDERDRVLITLLLNAGIRVGSAIGLNVEDVDFEHRELHLRTAKNDARAVAVLPAVVVEPLRKLIGTRETGPVFLAAADRRISMRHCQRRIARWFESANIRGKSAHALRHSFATGLLARTGDLRLVQAAMGHRSIVSTTIYAQVDRARLRAAVGA